MSGALQLGSIARHYAWLSVHLEVPQQALIRDSTDPAVKRIISTAHVPDRRRCNPGLRSCAHIYIVLSQKLLYQLPPASPTRLIVHALADRTLMG